MLALLTTVTPNTLFFFSKCTLHVFKYNSVYYNYLWPIVNNNNNKYSFKIIFLLLLIYYYIYIYIPFI